MLLFTFFPMSRDVNRVTDFNCLLSGAIVLMHFAASTNCLESISFFSFSAFNSRCNCALDLLPIGDSDLCCNTWNLKKNVQFWKTKRKIEKKLLVQFLQMQFYFDKCQNLQKEVKHKNNFLCVKTIFEQKNFL